MDIPNQDDLDAVLAGMPTAEDIGKWSAIAQSAAATIDRIDAAIAAEVTAIKANRDFTAEAKERHVEATRAKYEKEIAAARDALTRVQAQAIEVEPLLERADIAHLERVAFMAPEKLTPLMMLAQRLPDHMLYLAAKVAKRGERRDQVSVLFLEAAARDSSSHYVGLARKELSGLPEETSKAIANVRQITATASMPLAKARAALSQNSAITSLDKISSGLAKLRAGTGS